MTDLTRRRAGLPAAILTLALASMPRWGLAEPAHGIAMYGEPALPPDFVSLPYVDPDAPEGGRIALAELGTFDSLNPHILKGTAPYAIGPYVFETLMARSWDEPFTLYGLLAETVETGPNREWVAFTLRPGARFSDGSPVTVEDVVWSFEILGEEGHPRYRTAWSRVESIRQTGPLTVRIDFAEPDRELPLIMGLRPVLQKAAFEGRDFAESSMATPVGSGPYVVAEAEAGRRLLLRRDPDWWGRDLPINRGQHNLDELRYDFLSDAGVLFEAFKAGELDSYREDNPARWQDSYDFAAVQSGRIVKSEIPHDRPSGIYGLVFNTRRAVFADWRVRDALIHAFNYEFTAQTQRGGGSPRITSYFSNSVLGMREGPAEGRVRALLQPYADALLPGAMEGYALPVSDGSLRNRANLRTAMRRLEEAGWRPENGEMRNADGEPLRFEILLRQGVAEERAVVAIYTRALERLGVDVRVTSVDSAQYTERTDAFEFDMAFYARALSLSPGNEQRLYWGSEVADTPGSRNWMGMASPAADAMIEVMLNAEDEAEFVAAVRALDRVLTTGRYVIPLWFAEVSRIAHDSGLRYPDRLPVYGDWIGFQPDVWWREPEG